MKIHSGWRRFFSLVWLGILFGCAGTQVLQQQEVIKPVGSYNDPVIRDVAQMLYPGFLEIRDEFGAQFGNSGVHLAEYGLQVRQITAEASMPGGYYVAVETILENSREESQAFMDQAQVITEKYLHNVLVALSRDWNTVFSPSITGIRVVFRWGETRRSIGNMLTFLLKNEDIQNYLNARLTLQELVDQNWVEGSREGESLGRIELNGLGVEPL